MVVGWRCEWKDSGHGCTLGRVQDHVDMRSVINPEGRLHIKLKSIGGNIGLVTHLIRWYPMTANLMQHIAHHVKVPHTDK